MRRQPEPVARYISTGALRAFLAELFISAGASVTSAMAVVDQLIDS